jgi:hypothetical protein
MPLTRLRDECLLGRAPSAIGEVNEAAVKHPCAGLGKQQCRASSWWSSVPASARLTLIRVVPSRAVGVDHGKTLGVPRR